MQRIGVLRNFNFYPYVSFFMFIVFASSAVALATSDPKVRLLVYQCVSYVSQKFNIDNPMEDPTPLASQHPINVTVSPLHLPAITVFKGQEGDIILKEYPVLKAGTFRGVLTLELPGLPQPLHGFTLTTIPNVIAKQGMDLEFVGLPQSLIINPSVIATLSAAKGKQSSDVAQNDYVPVDVEGSPVFVAQLAKSKKDIILENLRKGMQEPGIPGLIDRELYSMFTGGPNGRPPLWSLDDALELSNEPAEISPETVGRVAGLVKRFSDFFLCNPCQWSPLKISAEFFDQFYARGIKKRTIPIGFEKVLERLTDFKLTKNIGLLIEEEWWQDPQKVRDAFQKAAYNPASHDSNLIKELRVRYPREFEPLQSDELTKSPGFKREFMANIKKRFPLGHDDIGEY